MRLCFVILVLLASAFSWAQHSDQPQKESAHDLRTQSILFSVEQVDSKKTFWLERSVNEDYFIRMKNVGEESIQKIDSRQAKKIDMDFASRFLKCQYELPAVEGECKVTLRLSMKGETQDICQKDEKKSQEIMVVVQDLVKRF
jgi:hypothetical protein